MGGKHLTSIWGDGPDEVPGRADVVEGRAQVADRQPQRVTTAHVGVRDERVAGAIDLVMDAFVRVVALPVAKDDR